MYVRTPMDGASSPCRLTLNSPLRTVFSLTIINKAGGLVYQREFTAGLRKLSTNDYLVLAGTFHGFVCLYMYDPINAGWLIETICYGLTTASTPSRAR